ncbi:hypothetical protein BCR44DRAFT_273856 [Catenaria anguillulae PL171]|uniref:Cytochrome c domain-containing protein n=1 Tax=Catenaria anguillulae PL171 TaxID=765915 RepID=A0A1Y2HTQ6_9FUNG|nr:hypothetical protein BCR44DRAFT_273856 [Catenaria anguillulae PL171]
MYMPPPTSDETCARLTVATQPLMCRRSFLLAVYILVLSAAIAGQCGRPQVKAISTWAPTRQSQREPPETLASTDIKLLHAHYINKGMLYITERQCQACHGILVGLAGSAYGNDAGVLDKLDAVLTSTDDGSGTMNVVGDGIQFLATALDAGLVVSMVDVFAPKGSGNLA